MNLEPITDYLDSLNDFDYFYDDYKDYPKTLLFSYGYTEYFINCYDPNKYKLNYCELQTQEDRGLSSSGCNPATGRQESPSERDMKITDHVGTVDEILDIIKEAM